MSTPAPRVQPPRLDAFDLGALAEGDPAELTANADLESVCFTDLVLERIELPGALVTATRFSGVSGDEVDLGGARLSEVELDRVGWPVVRATRGQWRDVRVSGRIGSLEAYDAQWRGVEFRGCKLSYVNLRGAELVDVAFTDCVIEELDLLEAVARRVRLRGTRVSSLDVQRSELHDVDLRGADLEFIDGVLDLRGATVSSDQLGLLAPLLADGLGLRVED